MNQKDTLKPYVESQLKIGTSAESIRQQLTANGWGDAIVDEVLAEVIQASQPVAPLPPIQPVLQSIQTAEQPVQSVQPQPAADAVISTEPVLTEQLQSRVTVGVSQPAKSNYGISDALKESFAALKANAVSTVVVAIIGFVVTVLAVVAILVAGIGTIFTLTAMGSGNTSFMQFGGALFMFFGVYVGVMALSSAFTQSIIGLAINDGAEGRKSNIKEVILEGVKRSPRVLLAIILFGAITAVPALFALILVFIFSAISNGLAIAGWLLAIIAIIAGPLIMLRLVLMPVVALFEPSVPIMSLFSRTRQLMKDGGALFVVKFMALAMLVSIVLSIILPSESEMENASTLTSVVVGVVGGLFYLAFSAVLVVFYRNRRTVRG